MLMSCCVESGKPNRKKKIKALQRAIRELNKTIEMNVEFEKHLLEMAAGCEERAREHEKLYGDRLYFMVLRYLERKKIWEGIAQSIAAKREPVVEEVALLESLIRKEIKAMQDD